MSVVAPNLGSLPDEVLVQIFARLLDVPSKVRLERVSRKFLRCINKQESWKNNTELRMREYEQSIPALRSFLKHTAVITQLFLDLVSVDAQIFVALWEFSHKLEVTEFRYAIATNCANNSLAVAFLANFSSTLEHLYFLDCGQLECGTRDTLLNVLPSLDNLHSLSFALYRNQNQMGPAIHNPVLDSLQQLTSLLTLDFYNCDNLDTQRLASVLNQNERIHSLRVRKGRACTGQLHFPLTNFCDSLSQAAARSLRTIKIEDMQIEWTNTLPSVPTIFPNLNLILLKVDGQNNAVQMARALGEFLRAGQGKNKKRKVPLTLDLEVNCNGTFGEELWAAVDLIEIVKSGTKRTQDMTKWSRKFKNGNISIEISVK